MDFDPDCPFCRWIEEGRAVDSFGAVVVLADGFPVTKGHLLIVPLRHVKDALSMTGQEVRDAETMIRRSIERIKREDPGVSGFNIGMNMGESAGQTVFHAHIHLIPRRKGDCPDPRGGVRGVIDGRRSYS